MIDVQRGRAVSVPSGTEVEISHASNLGGAIWGSLRSLSSPGWHHLPILNFVLVALFPALMRL